MKTLKTQRALALLVCLLPACEVTEREEDLLVATCSEVGTLLYDGVSRLCDPRVCAYQGVLFIRNPQICQFTLLVLQDFGYERASFSLHYEDLLECLGREAMCSAALLVALDRQYPLLVGPQDGRLLLDPAGGW